MDIWGPNKNWGPKNKETKWRWMQEERWILMSEIMARTDKMRGVV